MPFCQMKRAISVNNLAFGKKNPCMVKPILALSAPLFDRWSGRVVQEWRKVKVAGMLKQSCRGANL